MSSDVKPRRDNLSRSRTRRLPASWSDALRLSTLLRLNHVCSLLLYVDSLSFLFVCFLSLWYTFYDTDFDVYVRVDTPTADATQESTALLDWMSCKTTDSAGFAAVDNGISGVCASQLDPFGAPEPLFGCELDLAFLVPSTLQEAAQHCEEFCRCSTTTEVDCRAFSVFYNASSTFCRLHAETQECGSLLAEVPLYNNNNTDIDADLHLVPFVGATQWMNTSTLIDPTADGTANAECYAKQNTCPSNCLGMTCDELSTRLGVSCGYLEAIAGCNCAGCGCGACDKCLFPFEWRGQEWDSCVPTDSNSSDVGWCPLELIPSEDPDRAPLYVDGMARMTCPLPEDACDDPPTPAPAPAEVSSSWQTLDSSNDTSANDDPYKGLTAASSEHDDDVDRVAAVSTPASSVLCLDPDFVFGAASGSDCADWDAWDIHEFARDASNAGNVSAVSVLTPYDALSVRFSVNVDGQSEVSASMFLPRTWGLLRSDDATAQAVVALVFLLMGDLVFAVYHWFTAPRCTRRIEEHVNKGSRCHCLRGFQSCLKQGIEVFDILSVLCAFTTIILAISIATDFFKYADNATSRVAEQCLSATAMPLESLYMGSAGYQYLPLSVPAVDTLIAAQDFVLEDCFNDLFEDTSSDDVQASNSTSRWDYECAELTNNQVCSRGEVQNADGFGLDSLTTANIAACNWDGGDCCSDTNDFGSASCGPTGCDCRSTADPDRFDMTAGAAVPEICASLIGIDVDRVGDGICDACSDDDCDALYSTFSSPTRSCCSCGGGQYDNDFCVDTGWSEAHDARVEWDDDGAFLGNKLSAVVDRMDRTDAWVCSDYYNHGVCRDGELADLGSYFERWGVLHSSVISVVDGSESFLLHLPSGGTLQLSHDNILDYIEATSLCCVCGGGDSSVCTESDTNVTESLLLEVDVLATFAMQHTFDLCPANASVCSISSLEVRFHYAGMRLFYFRIVLVAFFVSFKLAFDVAWMFVRFKLRTVRSVQRSRCQTCRIDFSFDNLPHQCIQCGFFHCRTCCSYRILLPGLEETKDDNKSLGCFNCSMLQKKDVISSLKSHSFGDVSMTIAKLILIQCERLPAIQNAYLAEGLLSPKHRPSSKNSFSKSDGSASIKHMSTSHETMKRKSLRKARLMSKLRAKIGYFWHSAPATKNERKWAPSAAGAPSSYLSGLPPAHANTLGNMVEAAINQVEKAFTQLEDEAKSAAAAPAKRRVPEGLEGGLMDGERSLRVASQTFGFEQKHSFRSPTLQAIFTAAWRHDVRLIFGQKARRSTRKSIDASVIALLHRLAPHIKHDPQSLTDGEHVSGQAELRGLQKNNECLHYMIHGVGLSEFDAGADDEIAHSRSHNSIKTLALERALKSFWKLPQHQRDRFMTRTHDDSYLGLRLDPRVKASSAITPVRRVRSAGLFPPHAETRQPRVCFEVPECTLFLENCYLQVEGILSSQTVHVVVFHDAISCFAVDPESDDFGPIPDGFLLGRTSADRKRANTPNSNSPAPLGVQVDTESKDPDGATQSKKSSVSAPSGAEKKPIGLHIDNLLYYATFEEIESCSKKNSRGSKDNAAASHDIGCWSCVFKIRDPQYKHLKNLAAVMPASKIEPKGNVRDRFHIRTPTSHVVIGLPSEKFSDLLRELVTEKISSNMQLLYMNEFAATFPTRRCVHTFELRQRTGAHVSDSFDDDDQDITRSDDTANLHAQRVQLFTCGAEYFERVAFSMLQARSYIFIRDWRLGPDIYLRRRTGVAYNSESAFECRTDDEAYRLDNILLKKAREGVKIYIILYHEVAIYTGSEASVDRLRALHSNITVIRHRSRLADQIYWSHHEKMVNIDGCITYVGGLDLCHGRFDTEEHPLWDAVPPFLFPGCDYSNPQIRKGAWSRDAFATPHLDIPGLIRTQVAISRQSGVMLDENTNRHMAEQLDFGASTSDIPVGSSTTVHVPGTPEPKTPLARNALAGPQSFRSGSSGMLFDDTLTLRRRLVSQFHEDLQSGGQRRGSSARRSRSRRGSARARPSSARASMNVNMMRRQSLQWREQSSANDQLDTLDELTLHKRQHRRKRGFRGFKTLRMDLKPQPTPRVGWSRRLSDVSSYSSSRRLLMMDGRGGRAAQHASQQRYSNGQMMCRMPWHDTQCSVLGMAALDSAKAFVQSWNSICAEAGLHIPLWPYSETQQIINPEHIIKKYCLLQGDTKGATDSVDENADEIVSSSGEDDSEDDVSSKYTRRSSSRRKAPCSLRGFSNCDVQLLRSMPRWTGWRATESSIMKAYVSLIKHAQHFVYIENQFFMTSCSTKSHNIANTIGAAIQARIVKAIRRREKFRVVIFVPEHQDGPIENKITQTLLRYMQKSLTQGKRSLVGQIKMEISSLGAQAAKSPHLSASKSSELNGFEPRVEDYLAIYSLHKWEQHPHVRNMIGHSQIYIHSKMILVDDKHLIIGSANINDRSMLGKRDSEIAMKIDEVGTEMIGDSDGGLKNFRLRLWGQHFGVPVHDSESSEWRDLSDPMSDETWNFLRHRASQNTQWLQKVFPDMINNDYKTMAEFLTKKRNFLLEERKELQRIYGDDFTTHVPSAPHDDESTEHTDASDSTKAAEEHSALGYNDSETEKTAERLQWLNKTRGHAVVWQGKFARDTTEAEIKDDPKVRMLELASRGFFL